jgi:hypothetical protein
MQVNKTNLLQLKLVTLGAETIDHLLSNEILVLSGGCFLPLSFNRQQ